MNFESNRLVGMDECGPLRLLGNKPRIWLARDRLLDAHGAQLQCVSLQACTVPVLQIALLNTVEAISIRL